MKALPDGLLTRLTVTYDFCEIASPQIAPISLARWEPLPETDSVSGPHMTGIYDSRISG